MNVIQKEVERLDEMSVADLVARFEQEFGRPPRSKQRAYLTRRLASKAAEAATGGLSEVARKRLAELMAAIELPAAAPRVATGAVKPRATSKTIATGTTLTREWRGQQVVVRVTDVGFEHAGATFKSLTAVAKAVTGAHWNGRLFFGLTSRRSTT